MIQTTKPVRRETLSLARAKGGMRPLVITLGTTFVHIRPKGMRHGFTVTYDQIYTAGAKNAAEQIRKDRVHARKERKGK